LAQKNPGEEETKREGKEDFERWRSNLFKKGRDGGIDTVDQQTAAQTGSVTIGKYHPMAKNPREGGGPVLKKLLISLSGSQGEGWKVREREFTGGGGLRGRGAVYFGLRVR